MMEKQWTREELLDSLEQHPCGVETNSYEYGFIVGKITAKTEGGRTVSHSNLLDDSSALGRWFRRACKDMGDDSRFLEGYETVDNELAVCVRTKAANGRIFSDRLFVVDHYHEPVKKMINAYNWMVGLIEQDPDDPVILYSGDADNILRGAVTWKEGDEVE